MLTTNSFLLTLKHILTMYQIFLIEFFDLTAGIGGQGGTNKHTFFRKYDSRLVANEVFNIPFFYHIKCLQKQKSFCSSNEVLVAGGNVC